MNLEKSIITDIQSIISKARESAIRAVDHERVVMYWQIGQRIFEEIKPVKNGQNTVLNC